MTHFIQSELLNQTATLKNALNLKDFQGLDVKKDSFCADLNLILASRFISRQSDHRKDFAATRVQS